MRTKPKYDRRLTLVCSAAVVIAGTVAGVAQTPAAPQAVPNFIDARPLPQSDRGRLDEQEARRKAEDELKRLTTEADSRRRSDEDAKRMAVDADAKRRADEEAKRLAADAEAKRVAADAEAKRRADDAASRIAADTDAKRRADEENKRVAAETEANRVAAEADTKRRAEEENKRAAAETEAKRVAAEADTKRRADEENKRVAAETEAKRVAAEADTKRRADEENKRVASEAEAKRAAAETEAKRIVAETEARRKADEELKRAAAEAEEKRVAAAADAKRRADDEARRIAAAGAIARPDAQKLETARLVVRGRQLMTEGDFVGARLLLDRAATAGDSDAALAMADTFDAATINRIGSTGVTADAALAKYWRSRAQELGGANTVTAVPVSPPQPPATVASVPAPAARPSAPQPTTAAVPPVAVAASADAQRYITRGRQQLQQGDIDAARLFFERAFNAGAAEGAFELAATYDPAALSDLGVVGLQPDATRAAALYRKAQQMGAVGAAERLTRLGTR